MKRIHLRIAIGGIILLGALFVWIFLIDSMTRFTGIIPGGGR